MNKKFFLIAIMIASLLVLGGCSNGEEKAVSQIDNKSIPERTVSGTVAVLEMLDYLDIEMVAIPETSYKLDPKFDNVPNIGKPMNPDMELLKSVNPDMYISVISLEEKTKKPIEENNIDTLYLNNSSYSGILESMETLGSLYNKEEISNKFIKNVEEKSAEIKENVKDKEKPRVMILFGSPKSIMFATKNAFVGSLVEELGAINVVDELEDFEDIYVPVSMENVLGLKPDVILRLTHASPEDSKKMFDSEFAKSDIWKKLDAVKNGKVYDLDNKYFGVSGNIRILEAFQSLEKILYE